MLIATKYGLVPEERLLKWEDVEETDEHRIEFVEYCPSDCHGAAHVHGERFAAGCFCPYHVHRSSHVTRKLAAVAEG